MEEIMSSTKKTKLRLTQNEIEKRILKLHNLNKYPDDKIPNIWSIIEYGKTSYETRYSRFLRWLLDPKENHGIKSDFLDKLWVKLVSKLTAAEKKSLGFNGKEKWSDKTISRCEVFFKADIIKGSTKKERRFIDILVHDPDNKDRYLCIELKVLSDAHSNQLEAYAKHLKVDNRKFKKACGLFAFITPDDFSPDPGLWDPSWVCISYEDLRDVLDSILISVIKGISDEQDKTCEYITSFRSDLGKYINYKDFKDTAKSLYNHLDQVELKKNVYSVLCKNTNDENNHLIKRIEEDRIAFINSQMLVKTIFNDLIDTGSGASLTITVISSKAIECTYIRKDISDTFKHRVLKKLRIAKAPGRSITLYFSGDVHAYIVFTDNVKQIQLSRPSDGKIKVGEKEEKGRYKKIPFINFEDDVKDILDSYDSIMPYYYEQIDEYLKGI